MKENAAIHYNQVFITKQSRSSESHHVSFTDLSFLLAGLSCCHLPKIPWAPTSSSSQLPYLCQKCFHSFRLWKHEILESSLTNKSSQFFIHHRDLYLSTYIYAYLPLSKIKQIVSTFSDEVTESQTLSDWQHHTANSRAGIEP